MAGSGSRTRTSAARRRRVVRILKELGFDDRIVHRRFRARLLDLVVYRVLAALCTFAVLTCLAGWYGATDVVQGTALILVWCAILETPLMVLHLVFVFERPQRVRRAVRLASTSLVIVALTVTVPRSWLVTPTVALGYYAIARASICVTSPRPRPQQPEPAVASSR